MEEKSSEEYLEFEIHSRIPHYRDNLIKDSDWIDIADPYFTKKFQVLWEEHVDGFKKRKIRNPKDKDMEWRKRLAEKQSQKPPVVTDVTKAEILNRFKDIQKKKQEKEQNVIASTTSTTTTVVGPSINWKGASGGKGKILPITQVKVKNDKASSKPELSSDRRYVGLPNKNRNQVSIVGPKNVVPQSSVPNEKPRVTVGPSFGDKRTREENSRDKKGTKKSKHNK